MKKGQTERTSNMIDFNKGQSILQNA